MSLPTVFTVEDANRRLPYIRSIVRDITTLAITLQQREECLAEVRRLHQAPEGDSEHSDELNEMLQTIEGHRQQLVGFEKELNHVEVYLVDRQSGLVELRSHMDDRTVWLNWLPDEAEFTAWRADDDDPTMRRPLLATISDNSDVYTENFQDEN